MKTLTAIALAMMVTAANAAEPETAYPATHLCKRWTKAHPNVTNNNKTALEQTAWVWGFIEGIRFAYDGAKDPFSKEMTPAEAVTGYCLRHPDDTVLNAALAYANWAIYQNSGEADKDAARPK